VGGGEDVFGSFGLGRRVRGRLEEGEKEGTGWEPGELLVCWFGGGRSSFFFRWFWSHDGRGNDWNSENVRGGVIGLRR
jgi:hypothetical protein